MVAAEKYAVRLTVQQKLRADVWDKGQGRCYLCGATLHPFRDFHVEHVVPRCAGGSDALNNLEASCQRCNFHKRDTEDRVLCAQIKKRRPKGAPLPLGILPKLRRERGLSVAELAKRSGLKVATVVRAEAGDAIMWQTVVKLAHALNVERETLQTG